MKTPIILCFLACLAFLTACDKNSEPPLNTPPISQENLGEANLGFGLSLLKELDKTEPVDENILISPVSIQTAMNMAANGAEGNTLNEILSALHTGEWDIDQVNQRHKTWQSILTSAGGHPEVLIANGYFKDPNRIKTDDDFEARLAQYYNAGVERYDFSTEAALNHINGWVDNQTEGKIDKILEYIDSDEIAFLINALYFRSDWLDAFPQDLTSDRTFNLPDDSKIQIPFMSNDQQFHYVQSEAYTALDLPFKDETFSFTLLMPNEDQNIQQFISTLNAEFIHEMYDEIQESRAIVYIPLLDLSYKENLKDALQALGIKDAFSDREAEFTRMGTPLIGPRIFITRVEHKSVLTIDEKGAEGAAVTAVGFGATSLPPVLNFNRPFVIMLRHVETNSLLFTGRVANPAK